MLTIYKYPFHITDRQTIKIHGKRRDGFVVLHVGRDPKGTPSLWFEVDPDAPEEHTIEVVVVGTGGKVPDVPCRPFAHAGSFLDDPFVWHVYLRSGPTP